MAVIDRHFNFHHKEIWETYKKTNWEKNRRTVKSRNKDKKRELWVDEQRDKETKRQKRENGGKIGERWFVILLPNSRVWWWHAQI
jgi:hypothetical protein